MVDRRENQIQNESDEEEDLEETKGLSWGQKGAILGSWIIGGAISLFSEHPADGLVLAAGITTVVCGYSAANNAYEKSRQVAVRQQGPNIEPINPQLEELPNIQAQEGIEELPRGLPEVEPLDESIPANQRCLLEI